MTKRQKLLKKVLSGSRNVRFDDFVKLLEAFGFTFERITGSHHIFSHPAVPQAVSIQPNKSKQAKPYQIEQFLRLIEKYNLQMEESDDQVEE